MLLFFIQHFDYRYYKSAEKLNMLRKPILKKLGRTFYLLVMKVFDSFEGYSKVKGLEWFFPR